MALPMIPVALLLGSLYWVAKEADKQEKAGAGKPAVFTLREQPVMTTAAKDLLAEIQDRTVGKKSQPVRVFRPAIRAKLSKLFRGMALEPVPKKSGGNVKGMFKLVPWTEGASTAEAFLDAAYRAGKVGLATFSAPMVKGDDVDALVYVVRPELVTVAAEGTQWAILFEPKPKVAPAVAPEATAAPASPPTELTKASSSEPEIVETSGELVPEPAPVARRRVGPARKHQNGAASPAPLGPSAPGAPAPAGG